MKILIGTKNEGKIEGAKKALLHYFDDFTIEAVDVNSEIGEQPINEEILKGAKNRIKNLKKYAKENQSECDFYMAIETGITNQLGEWVNLSIAVVEDQYGNTGMGTSAGFPIPEQYIQEIKQTNLANVSNKLFDEDNEKHQKEGTVKLLTKGVISRINLTQSAFIMALTIFINGEKWR